MPTKETDKKMKLIKTSTTRTSQACDRCRIKKIKCDGALPSCSNCLKIGYDCKISDKLTRRAFPRGYTENLEKNLITLQNEIVTLNEEIALLKETGVSNSCCDANNVASKAGPDLAVNFFKFNNYLINSQYFGLNSLQTIFNNLLTKHNLPLDIKESKDDELVTDSFLLDKFINNFPSKHNLDLIIQQHFAKLNKLIPIINESNFFDVYKDGINKFNSDFVVQIVLIIQLNCSIFSIHDIHKLITNQFNIVSPSLIKFENLLLSVWLFHNKNCYSSTVISITNLLKSMVLNLGLHLNYNNLYNNVQSESKEEKFKNYSHRLELYWCFHILNRLCSIIYGLPDSQFFDSFQIPKLSTLVGFNDDLKYPLKLIELVDYDWNLLSEADSKKIEFINNWYHGLDIIDDDIVKLQLKLYGLTFKILLNIDANDNSEKLLEIMSNLNNSKETGLNNFEFHLIPLNFVKIMIISLFNILNKDITIELSNLVKENIYKSIKLRYPENFILFKEILEYIITKSSLESPSLSNPDKLQLNNSVEPVYQSLFTKSASNTPTNSSATNLNKVRNHSIVSTSSIESILSNNRDINNSTSYKTNLGGVSSLPKQEGTTTSLTLGGDNMINLLNEDPSNTTKVGLLFDWGNAANGTINATTPRDNNTGRDGFNLVI